MHQLGDPKLPLWCRAHRPLKTLLKAIEDTAELVVVDTDGSNNKLSMIEVLAASQNFTIEVQKWHRYRRS